MNQRNLLPALSLALCVTSNICGADPTFTLIDYPGAVSTQSWGINSRGDIVGFYVKSDTSSHGFLLSGGHYTAIDFPGAAVTIINGINSRGDIVGEYGVTLTSKHRGFLLGIDGVFTSIDFPGATFSSAIGITPDGNIAGIYAMSDNVNHGFQLSGGHYTSIDFPGSTGTAPNGITPQGEIVGGYKLAGVTHGFTFNQGSFATVDYPNAAFTVVTGKNASGDIAGRWTDSANVNHGFLLSAGKFTSFDLPNSTFTGATAIDPGGNILGRCTIGGVTHGFLMNRQAPLLSRYIIKDLGPVGGSPGQPFVLTDNGLIGGASVQADNSIHAVIWNGFNEPDLGTPGLGGLNSMALGINPSGLAVGAAETGNPDPKGEDFCGFRSYGLSTAGVTCVPFSWQYGVMSPLRTLGGNNGVANMVNSRGQIAGFAENNTLDPACQAPQVLQFKPVIWENGEVFELPTAPGDLNGVALAINESGQIAGGSGHCAEFNQGSGNSLQPLHALLWQTGKVVDLGSLGGTGRGNGIVAANLNNLGQVVGNSDLPGDKNFHAFLWSKVTGMQDLGTLPGDTNSAAFAISDSGVVLGASLDADFNPRAFIYQNGAMADLNKLVVSNSSLFLWTACSVNARGEIIGMAATKDGEIHGYLASPIGAALAQSLARPIVLSEDVRKRVRNRLSTGLPGVRSKPSR